MSSVLCFLGGYYPSVAYRMFGGFIAFTFFLSSPNLLLRPSLLIILHLVVDYFTEHMYVTILAFPISQYVTFLMNSLRIQLDISCRAGPFFLNSS